MPLVALKVLFSPTLPFLPGSKLALLFECTHRVLTNIRVILICQCRTDLLNSEPWFRGCGSLVVLVSFHSSLSAEDSNTWETVGVTLWNQDKNFQSDNVFGWKRDSGDSEPSWLEKVTWVTTSCIEMTTLWVDKPLKKGSENNFVLRKQ